MHLFIVNAILHRYHNIFASFAEIKKCKEKRQKIDDVVRNKEKNSVNFIQKNKTRMNV